MTAPRPSPSRRSSGCSGAPTPACGRNAYAERRPSPARTPAASDLCPVTGRGRLSYERAEYLFKQGSLKVASRGWTLHQLRHSALTHLAEEGVNLTLLMAKSGHQNLRSLQRYARPGSEAVAAMTAAHDPPGDADEDIASNLHGAAPAPPCYLSRGAATPDGGVRLPTRQCPCTLLAPWSSAASQATFGEPDRSRAELSVSSTPPYCPPSFRCFLRVKRARLCRAQALLRGCRRQRSPVAVRRCRVGEERHQFPVGDGHQAKATVAGPDGFRSSERRR